MGHGDRGDGTGLDDEESGPTVEKAPDGPIGIAQEDVLPSGFGKHGRQFGVAQPAHHGHDPGDGPDYKKPAGRTHIAGDVRRDDEDAGPDHRAGNKHAGMEKTDLMAKFWSGVRAHGGDSKNIASGFGRKGCHESAGEKNEQSGLGRLTRLEARTVLGCQHLVAKNAVLNAVREVDHQSQRQPNQKSEPIPNRQ